MNPADASLADRIHGTLDLRRDLLRRLDVVHLDVRDPDAKRDAVVDVLERLEIALGPVREFEHEVVGTETVEEVSERLPRARLDRLPAVVAEAEMHGAFALHAVEDAVDGLGGERRILRATGDVRLVHLHARTRQLADLIREHIGDSQCQVIEVTVVIVEERAGEHEWTRQRELKRAPRHRRRTRTRLVEVEAPLAKCIDDHTRGLAAEAHLALLTERPPVRNADFGLDSADATDEVLDHPVRVGMVGIEAVELAVCRQVDPGTALRVDDHARRVDHRLLVRECREPVDGRIRADGRR